MSRNANPVVVGGFVLGTLAVTVMLVIFFNSGGLWNRQQHYTLIYDRSIKGLSVGAPVTIKGVKIGEVTEITARMTKDTAIFNSVVITINPEALEREGEGKVDSKEMMEELVDRGLRAQLRLQSLLTAMLYVDIDFHPDKPANVVDIKTRYKQLPTIPTDLEELQRNLESIDFNKLGENLQDIVNGVNQLINDKAIQRISGDVSDTLVAVRDAANQLNHQTEQLGQQLVPLTKKSNRTLDEINRKLPQLMATLDTTMHTLQQTAQTLDATASNTAFLTSEDSPLLYRIDNAASSVNAAAEQLRRLTETLDDQPESLIYGKSEEPTQ